MCCIFYSKHSVRTQSNSYPFQFSLVTFRLCRALDANINSQKTQTYKFVYFTNHDADRSDINCVVCNLSNSFAQLNEASNFFLITSHCTAKNLPCKLQCRSLIWQFLTNITEIFSNSHMFIGSCRMYQWQGTSPCYLGNRRLLQFGPGHKILLIFSHIWRRGKHVELIRHPQKLWCGNWGTYHICSTGFEASSTAWDATSLVRVTLPSYENKLDRTYRAIAESTNILN